MLLTVAVLIQLNMKQRTISMLTSFLSIAFLFGLASSKPTQTSTGNYIHGTDIVTEILQAIDRREEMWKITSYLNASRDELSKELPLVNPGKYSFKILYFFPSYLTQNPRMYRWDQNQLHILRTDVDGLYGANSAKRIRSDAR